MQKCQPLLYQLLQSFHELQELALRELLLHDQLLLLLHDEHHVRLRGAPLDHKDLKRRIKIIRTVTVFKMKMMKKKILFLKEI